MEEAYSPEIIEAMEKAANSEWHKDRQLRAAAPLIAKALKDILEGEYSNYIPSKLFDSAKEALRKAGIE